MWKFMLHKMFKMREKFAVDLGKGDVEKPFIEHLDDLRTMVVRMAITILLVTLGTFFFYKELIQLLLLPLTWSGVFHSREEAMKALITTDPTGAFMTAMNVTLIAGLIIAFPLLLLFLLQFVLPGLKDNEKKLIFPALGVATGLFLSGVLFAYFFVLPRALEFFWGFGTEIGITPMWSLNEYITFATRFVLVFGIAFELPVLVMILVKLDILNYKLMSGTRPHAIVAISIFAAVITPTQDALTMLLMIAPLYILYEACIWIARSMEKKDREMYPEYYEAIDKSEADLKAAEDNWDNEDYNPWSGNDDDDDESKPSADASSSADKTSKPVSDEKKAEPEREKSLEEQSREDEQRNQD